HPGAVLTAHSELWTAQAYRAALGRSAAMLDHRPGRTWRNLQDTAAAAALLYYTPEESDSWRRSVDYYDEGELDWSWADSIIRQQTGGKRSIDDFCKLFHGAPSTPP